MDYFVKTPPTKRKKYTPEEFAAKYGAHPDDISKVVKFAEQAGLQVIKTNPAQRTVLVSGTVAQMSKAFAITLNRYQHTITRYQLRKPQAVTETYMGHDGSINIPKNLTEIIVGVFGLDNRSVTTRNQADPPGTCQLTIQQVTQLYNFPKNSANGQTIGILAPTGGNGGYFLSDLQKYFNPSNPTAPLPFTLLPDVSGDDVTFNSCVEVVPTAITLLTNGGAVLTLPTTDPYGVSTANILKNSKAFIPAINQFALYTVTNPVHLSNGTQVTLTMTGGAPSPVANAPAGATFYFNSQQAGETTQDIIIAAAAAPGANIQVIFCGNGSGAWQQAINTAMEPGLGISVLSISWGFAQGDDPTYLSYEGISTGLVTSISTWFEDVAITGDITIVVSSGDWGSDSKVGDGHAHVQYPASDPWVLAVGGTTIGNTLLCNQPTAVAPKYSQIDEWVWNDSSGATGGGVSDLFEQPSYQNGVGVPNGLSFNNSGRGVPDVAANASCNSTYEISIATGSIPACGTSAAAPLWAALIALINAQLNEYVGFINPSIYQLGQNPALGAFNQITTPATGPQTNGYNGVTGYAANVAPGKWNACTGWGSPNGVNLLNNLQSAFEVFVFGGFQSPDITLIDYTINPPWGSPVLPGGPPYGPDVDTTLVAGRQYGFFANVHNDSSKPANVMVSFWALPGGVGTNGVMVGVPQPLTIPPYRWVQVSAANQAGQQEYFTNQGGHQCAVISIYNPPPNGNCPFDGTNSSSIPDPGLPLSHECSAWRNTDSGWGFPGYEFGFNLGMGIFPIDFHEHVLLQIHSTYVPSDWNQNAKVQEIQNILRLVGATNNLPLFLSPIISGGFNSMDLKARVTAIRGGRIEEKEANNWHLIPHGKEENISFKVSGEIPKSAKKGDIVLVTVTAHYPKSKNSAARSVEFLEVIHVRDQMK